MKRLTSMIVLLAMLLSMIPSALAADEARSDGDVPETIGADTVWSYLDDNTDPAGDSESEDYNRTAWTAEDFDDSAWKQAAGPFGSKRGTAAYDSTHTAATVLAGCDGANDTPTYFFRTDFRVSTLDGMTKLVGSLQYDDGVVVYINGQKVAAGHDIACDAETGASLGHGFNANNQYGGSNQGPDTLNLELLDLSVLHEGTNTIAVELHNGRRTSSDVWFAMSDLHLSNEKVEYQSNCSLSMGADESKMNFTWYSPLEDAELIISSNADMTEAESVKAVASAANDGQYSCKATAEGLTAETIYYYQLSNAGHCSEIFRFTTGAQDGFSFAFAGDPQIGASGNAGNDTNGWEKTLNQITTSDIFSDVSFLLSAGDQVNTANNEAEYDGYLDHDALTGLPAATVVGNHDSGSNAYSQHFNVANESEVYGTTAAGGDSYFVYNNVLFLVLNSNDRSTAEHRAFMEEAIAATENMDIQWKVVTFHHSIYSVASHAADGDILGRRDELVPVFKELDIDVVLMGHDHVYVRSYMMDGLTPITESDKYTLDENGVPESVTDPDGILYVTANSASGSKMYSIKTNMEFPYAAVKNQEYQANISKVSVDDEHFTVTTYRTADLSEVDTFTIYRTVEEETDYNVAFNTDEHADIDVYYTKDYTEANETGVVQAIARSGDTGEIDCSGDGQVNFKIRVEEGYEIDSVTADANYKNLKTPAETGADGIYRLTKITGDVTVTITTKKTETSDDSTGGSTGGGSSSSGDGSHSGGSHSGGSTSTGGSSAGSGTTPVPETPPYEAPAVEFVDVKSDAFYFDAVVWAVKNHITTGTSETEFSPEAGCTRGQIVTFLWRAAGCPEPASDSSFRDVPADRYDAKAVAWAVEQGITNGTSPETFQPDLTCTRGQIVTFLWRAAGCPAAASDSGFRDVPPDRYDAKAVAWAVKQGITNGTSPETFQPDTGCTRGHVVTFLYRAEK